MGMGKNISMSSTSGNIMAKAISSPNTAPDAPTVGIFKLIYNILLTQFFCLGDK